jgi:hypothetical protein
VRLSSRAAKGEHNSAKKDGERKSGRGAKLEFAGEVGGKSERGSGRGVFSLKVGNLPKC